MLINAFLHPIAQAECTGECHLHHKQDQRKRHRCKHHLHQREPRLVQAFFEKNVMRLEGHELLD